MTPAATPPKIEPAAAQAGGGVPLPDFAPAVPKPTLGLALRTLRHLSLTQLGRLAQRRLWPDSRAPRRVRGQVSLARLPRVPQFPEWRPAAARQMIRSLRFDFLHVTNPPGEGIPWSPAASASSPVQYPRLWFYHLNYFDFLNVDLTPPGDVPDLRAALAVALHWLERNRSGREVGWEPYPLSLRIVNWLKFLVRHRASIESLGEVHAQERIVASLAEQTATLEGRLEYDLRANHLLKNIKALLFAAALLDCAASERRWATGARLLERELDEQILPDGGHFERSPMYHLQVLEDLIDLQELSVASDRLLGPAGRLAERIAAMAAWARALSHPDGEIPLLNDSAFGEARPLTDVLALAERCLSTQGKRAFEQCPELQPLTVFPQTGYAVIRDAASNSALIFDCGPLGPDYNPGHGHCDVLSYELSLYGQRVVTDTGVSTYEQGPERHYERSTAAHNTIRIDGEEQAEIWACFRVGHRPRVACVEGEEVSGFEVVRGAHFGYQRRGVTHSRTVVHTPENVWVIVDSVTGTGDHRVESFIHFHPGVSVEPVEDSEPSDLTALRPRFIVECGGRRYRLATLGPGEITVTGGWYASEFGRCNGQAVMLWTARGPLPLTLICALAPVERMPVIRLSGQNAVEIAGVSIRTN